MDSQRWFYIDGKCWVGNDMGNFPVTHLYNTFVVAIFENKEITQGNKSTTLLIWLSALHYSKIN